MNKEDVLKEGLLFRRLERLSSHYRELMCTYAWDEFLETARQFL